MNRNWIIKKTRYQIKTYRKYSIYIEKSELKLDTCSYYSISIGGSGFFFISFFNGTMFEMHGSIYFQIDIQTQKPYQGTVLYSVWKTQRIVKITSLSCWNALYRFVKWNNVGLCLRGSMSLHSDSFRFCVEHFDRLDKFHCQKSAQNLHH